MAIIPHSPMGESLNSTVGRFFRDQGIGKLLRRCNFDKERGFECVKLLRLIFLLVFTRKNLYRALHEDGAQDADEPEKSTFYRFLNSCRFNWRKLLLLLSSQMIANSIGPLTGDDRQSVLIVDDSMFSRDRSKRVELLARLFDHATGRFMKGFRMLTLGWSDGNTFLPVAFSLLSSAKEKNRINDTNEAIDKRTVGYRRRHEAVQKGTDMLVELVRQAMEAGIHARYVLFDSWFAFPSTIIKVLGHKLDVVCMLKAMPNIRYEYQGTRLDLKALYAKLKKRRGRAKILASVVVTLGTDAQGKPVRAQIVFVRDRRGGSKWLALLSTDLDLAPEEVVRIYGKRWDIEVFFKMTKSYLGLAKEFQGRSYDMMVAHTTIVCIRYMMLALEARNHEDPRTLGELFFHCCDELQDLNLATALLLIMDLFKQTAKEVLVLSETQIDGFLQYFFKTLPSSLRRLFELHACES